MKKLIVISANYIMRSLFLLVSLIIVWSILFNWSIYYSTDYYLNILGVIGIIVLLIGILYLTRKMKGSYFIGLLLLIAFSVQLFWIIYSKVEPISDFSYMLNGAKHLANGNFQAVKADDYFFWYTTQLGYPVFEALIIKFSSGSLITLQLMNSLFILGTIYLIYDSGKNCINEQAGRIASLFYASYIGLFIMVPVLTNQHSSAFFIFLGLRLLIHPNFKRTLWMRGLVGLCLAVGNILYPIGILFLISIFLYIVFYMGISEGGISVIDKLKSIGMVIGVYLLTLFVFSVALLGLGISNHSIQHYDNNWKFVLGLNQETNGQYSLTDFETLLPSYLARDEEEHTKIEKKLIQERLNQPKEVVELIVNKTLYMWGMPNDSYKYANIYPSEKKTIEAVKVPYVRIESSQYFVISLFMLLSGVCLLVTARNLTNNKLNLYTIAMLGGFLIYFIIEIQVRYRYFFIPMMCLLASYSFSLLSDRVSKRLSK
ncbi:hypothetical protein [Carnobacterium divergens]|uniref:Glycosyltransferase RgtA/B/C/D-like domain-containing protein n=1 Tax=Carnobacterium divergens TaxID=2748 RepID=A0AAW8R5I9_CARDV|nr:hypothetical protein [Carnobacterium divergens]MDT1957039.1 hypothetical protein [Carnobacterium divergens]MDT1973009.1 hypothetical protein [Carnobacterium divergens]MDT2012679.1 hypothetical protein [Carnobacterium divergens]